MSKELKICGKCGESKNIECFSWKIKSMGIRSSQCKECYAKYYRKYYKSNKEQILNKNNKWQKSNLDKCREYNKQYRKKYLERYKEICKIASHKYRINNLDTIRCRNKLAMQKYRKDNPEKTKEIAIRYRKSNPEKIKESNKQWALKNHSKKIAYNARRRALKKKQTPANINKNLIEFYYNVSSTLADYEVDHIKPLAKGGLHHQNNLQLLPKKLNLEKSDKWTLSDKEKERYKGLRL